MFYLYIVNSTKIEWTEASWNPSIGCTKVSAGCRNCYAENMARYLSNKKITENVWMGVTVEDKRSNI